MASPPSSFDRIALSLSGGGFRASAYSLGTLKALYLLGLLDNVHMLSTASGGTITGAYYAMRRKSGHTFVPIYQDFYHLLEQDRLLPNALARWEQNIKNAPHRYKLIQAFADTYSMDLFGEARLGLFWEPDASPTAPFHLQSLIFGATELYSGLTFRFQHGAFLPSASAPTDDAYIIGNGNVRLPSHHARQLRLGDVVAASSCFPGGFEPLIMPDDFLPGHQADVLRGGNTTRPTSVALLDGGIYDNQGIESLLLANERNRKYAAAAQHTHTPQQARLLQPSTLFLVADVSGAEKDLYQAPRPSSSTSYSPTLGHAFLVLAGSVFLAGGAAYVLAQSPATQFWGGLLAGLGLTGGAGTLALAWGWHRLGTVLRHAGPDLPGWVRPRLKQLSLRQLRTLLGLRVGSTAALLTSVFMRRVRSLNYDQLYRRPAPDRKKPTYDVLSSIIGRIVTDYEQQQKSRKPRKSAVRNQLAAVYPTVLLAQEMPTTLWWQHDLARLPAIVASAEITLYYQLLRRFEKQFPSPGTRDGEVQRRAQLLWNVYQTQKTGYLLPINMLAVLSDPACTVAQLTAHNVPPQSR